MFAAHGHIRSFLTATLVLLLPSLLSGLYSRLTQVKPDIAELEMRSPGHANYPASSASEWFDVSYYKLDLSISASPAYLKGFVTIRGTCNQYHPGFLVLDLADPMHVDSVIIDGHRNGFNQQALSFLITLDSLYGTGSTITAVIYYQGVPVPTGNGSFEFSSHGGGGSPWIWSLSEPYGARDWWPCRDHPSDKADSADILITVDTSLKAGSNGILSSVTANGDGTHTYHWKEQYPISTYLISVAISNYAVFSGWFRYSSSDSMEVLNYVLPESLDAARAVIPKVIDGLAVFSDLFGLYPFVSEKYGHSQFGSGAMEHQTMTSTVSFDESVLIHELAHQWFGDMITCRTWQDIWLNEGFATFLEALYQEKQHGAAAYQTDISGHMTRAKNASGPVHVEDTTSIRNLFSGPLVYSKGAVVLHMLRHVLGDTVFFRCLRAYAGNPGLRYGTASTGDFRGICERTSGRDLGFFFDEWIYGEGFPHYNYMWSTRTNGDSSVTDLSIAQTSAGSSPSWFTMPLDIRLSGPRGLSTTVTIYNDGPLQSYSFTTSFPIDTVVLDPDNWVLKEAVGYSGSMLPGETVLAPNYPNPFRNATVIRYDLPHRTAIHLTVYNVLGEVIEHIADGEQIAGPHIIVWNAKNLPVGTYFLCLSLPDRRYIRPMAVVR